MKKKYLRGLVGLFLLAFVLILGWNFYHANDNPTAKAITTSSEPKIWVLSDTHFIADSLHDEGKRFRYMEATAASKDLKYGTVLLTSLVKKAIKEKPTAIIITGDVTFNGAKKSAEQLADIFAPLKKNNIKFLVIPGNHDIYDGWARSFKGDEEYKTKQISPNDWKQIFKTSYEDATSVDPASLSYTIQLNDKYQLLMVDTNKYTVGESNTAPFTNGTVRPATISWMKDQLAAAKKKGLKTISFTHHNLYEHSSRGKAGYVIKNYEVVQKLYKKYDVKLNFAGHIHAQDIAGDETKYCPTIEVLNGSFAVSPNSYGEVKLTNDKITYQKKELDIAPFLTATEKKNHDLAKHKEYAKKLFMNSTKAIMYERLYSELKDEPELMDEAAAAFAAINYHFFAGTDHFTDKQVTDFEKTTGYKALIKYGGMNAGYAKKALQDTNMLDNSLTIKMTK